MGTLPAFVTKLFWEVDPARIDLVKHRDYVIERVMTRGTWAAMRWLQQTYPLAILGDFVRRKGQRLPPREEAYWALIADVEITQRRGGGEPPWAGHRC